ncbi:MAG: FAD-dependent oxidoreductase [Chthoniobacter sp.]
MRRFLFPLLLLLATPVLRAQEYDVLVYGATPSGIAAAIAAAKDGEHVLLVEPSRRIGGMMTNGLSHTDIRTVEGMNGAYLDFARRVGRLLSRNLRGRFAPGARLFSCIQFEPKVALATFQKMLAEQPKIELRTEWALDGTKSSSNGDGEGPATSRAVEIALFFDGDGAYHSVAAHYFIDATYEGDLAGCARAAYRVGREAGSEFGESLAPDEADDQLQAYNFRLCMTRDPANRAPVEEPPGYLRNEFVDLLALLLDGRIHGVFSLKPTELIKAQGPLPNGKYDINDMSKGLVRLSLPGENDGWPEGESGFAAPRRAARGGRAFSRARACGNRATGCSTSICAGTWGSFTFCRMNEAVPAKFREEAREWGWCKDEFLESSHLPMELYVREARRVTGEYIFTEKDTDCAPDDARAVLHKDAIAMGDYGPNCHGTSHQGSRFGGRHNGRVLQDGRALSDSVRRARAEGLRKPARHRRGQFVACGLLRAASRADLDVAGEAAGTPRISRGGNTDHANGLDSEDPGTAPRGRRGDHLRERRAAGESGFRRSAVVGHCGRTARSGSHAGQAGRARQEYLQPIL